MVGRLASLAPLVRRQPHALIAPARSFPFSALGCVMTEVEFEQLARAGYNRVPVILETFADLDTPLSIYLKLANRPYTYLLESVVGGERFGRYSFIGLAAQTRLEVRGMSCTEIRSSRTIGQTTHADPLAYISAYLARFNVAQNEQLPRF